MHRIMADLMSKDFEIVSRPSEENYIMHVPEPNESNVGNSGAQGVFHRLYDQQQLTAKILVSGPFIPFYEWKHEFQLTRMKSSTNPAGVKYTIEPSFLVDVDGDAVVDALNPLGTEEAYSIGRWRAIAFGTSESGHFRGVYYPRSTELKLAREATSNYGYVAMAVWIDKRVNNHIWFSFMSNRRRGQAAPGVTWPYCWEEPFESSTFSAGWVGTFQSCVDIVEFDDGSIFLAVTVDEGNNSYQGVLVYRSFDYGATWTYCGTVVRVYYGPDDQAVSIERINERLVVVYSCTIAGHTEANIYYSDDFGLTWTAGDNFIDTDQDCKQCLILVKGRDNVLYLAYTLANGALVVNEVSIEIRRTLDGSSLSAATSTGLDLDTFDMIQDSTGTWMIIGRYKKGSEAIACTVDAASNVVTAAGHTYHNTDRVVFDTLDDETKNLTCNDFYYVRDAGVGTFKVAATSGGAAIDVTGNLVGTVHEVSLYEYELAVAYNENSPTTDTWSETPSAPVVNDYHFLTQNFSTPRKMFRDVSALAIENHQFIDLLAGFMVAYREKNQFIDTLSYGEYYTYLTEFKLAMWSGITPDDDFNIWDYTWFATCYPSTSDAEPNIHKWTKMSAGGGTATLTNDAAINRSYLRLARGVGGAVYVLYRVSPGNCFSTGMEARFCARVNSGNACMPITAGDGGANGAYAIVCIDAVAGAVKIYDYYKGGGAGVVATFTPTNWAVTDWNVYHVIYKGTKIYVYRSTDQFAELLNMELILSYATLGNGGPPVDAIEFSLIPLVSDAASQADFESVMVNVTGIHWTSLPVDQDEDLTGRRAYYYPVGLYAGMSIKFDGTYGVKEDTWTIETGALHEMENVFNPSPSVAWKSSSYASDPTGTEPDEVMVWKQKNADGQVYQTVQGFAVFGRNWPYCKLEGSVDNSNWTTLFQCDGSYPDKAYILKFAHAGSSVYNKAIVTVPAGMPAIHVNRFASTPEISYYLMATSGPEKYRIYRIKENDEACFYLETQLQVGMTNGNEVIVFSDRFYYDFSHRAKTSSVDFDSYGDSHYLKAQYRYFRLTTYGRISGTNFIFPVSDSGLKKTGSIHLGRVYDLPNEEWGMSMSVMPVVAINESRTGRKEYKRLGISRRNISLSYTGIVERGLGINPVVDLNRALGWGENPLVFIDDADILQYGDSDSGPDYGTYTHPNPILVRMVDGYQLSRAAMTYEQENNGGSTMDLVRNIVDISGIRLEEVV